MKTESTPGPWTVDHLGQIIGPRDGCSHEIIAHMPVWFPVAPPGKHATQDHIIANAALIASAPTLLAQRNELRAALELFIEIEKSTEDKGMLDLSTVQLGDAYRQAHAALKDIAECAEQPATVHGDVLARIASVARAALAKGDK